jgi:hypothetical protein
MDAQPLLDQALHQHEDAKRDEEARPGAEIEQERARRGRADRLTRDGAQHERHAPGDPDQDRRAPTGLERPLPKQPHAPLQIVERPAACDPKIADLARPTAGGVGRHPALLLRRYVHGQAP